MSSLCHPLAVGAVATLQQPYSEKPPCHALLPRKTNRNQQSTRGSCSNKKGNGVALPSPGGAAVGAVAALLSIFGEVP